MGKQSNFSYEEIENGFILSFYTYDTLGSDPIIGPAGRNVRLYCADEEDLATQIGELVTDDLYPE